MASIDFSTSVPDGPSWTRSLPENGQSDQLLVNAAAIFYALGLKGRVKYQLDWLPSGSSLALTSDVWSGQSNTETINGAANEQAFGSF